MTSYPDDLSQTLLLYWPVMTDLEHGRNGSSTSSSSFLALFPEPAELVQIAHILASMNLCLFFGCLLGCCMRNFWRIRRDLWHRGLASDTSISQVISRAEDSQRERAARLELRFFLAETPSCQYEHLHSANMKSYGDTKSFATSSAISSPCKAWRHVWSHGASSACRTGEALECVVCMEVMSAESIVRKLPCGHVYHSTCIEAWLLKNRSSCVCPLCKRDPTGSMIGCSLGIEEL